VSVRGEPVPGGDALLVADGIDASYGRLPVLFGASLTVAAGERVALLGTNGAGKSTLLRVLAGLHPPDGGRVYYAGDDVTGLAPEERVRRGLCLVEGGRAVFPSLSVRDNLRIGAFPWIRDRARVERGVEGALAVFPTLRTHLAQTAGTLSGGEQQMIAVARGIVSEPTLLMVDELSLGLAPLVMQAIVAAVEEFVAAGVTMLLVEQSLNVALALAGRAYFMEKGEMRFAGPADELLDRGDLVRSVFFGATAVAP
jgi:ABC-type branched-subunit amino acid transport system ATPase component